MIKKAYSFCKAGFEKVCGYVKKGAVAIVSVVTGGVLVTKVANAGIDFTDITILTTDIFTFAGIILFAIAAIWGIKRLLALGSK